MWWEEACSIPVNEIAVALGLHETRGQGLSPCPSCGAEYRSKRRNDYRGPVGLTRDNLGWRCHRCDAGGSGIDMTAAVLFSGSKYKDLTKTDRVCVREWFVRHGWTSGNPSGVFIPKRKPIGRKPQPDLEPHKYPDSTEVMRLWESSLPATEDHDTSSWLESRGLDPVKIQSLNLARTLDKNIKLPVWASFRRRGWFTAGYRLIFPMWDAKGRMKTLHARRFNDHNPKAVAPSGYELRGTILACNTAKRILETGKLPEHLSSADQLKIIITEGEPDFLTWATRENPNKDYVVIGVISGSWPDDSIGRNLASRIPEGSHIYIRIHGDEKGKKYVDSLTSTFKGRKITLYRRK